MKNAKDELLFSLLVETYKCKEYASNEYEGVTDAMNEYDRLHEQYNNKVNVANNDIKNTMQVVGSLRVCTGKCNSAAYIIRDFK